MSTEFLLSKRLTLDNDIEFIHLVQWIFARLPKALCEHKVNEHFIKFISDEMERVHFIKQTIFVCLNHKADKILCSDQI